MPNDLTPYEVQIQQFRQDRERSLQKADRGWLTLAGLFHLHEGENSFGRSPENDIVLPTSAAPPRGGVFVLKDNKVTIRPNPNLLMLCNGGRLPSGALASDQEAVPDFLTIGKLTLVAIQRASQHYIRMWNLDNPARKDFSNLNFYPIDLGYCIDARYTPYTSPINIKIIDVLGNEHEVPHTGYAAFEWNGQTCKLMATGEEDTLSFSFRDATNGDTTYGGGRELETGLPKDGIVKLDFNLAHNPPCAYTNFATCPLPPVENTLTVRIEAGEMRYQKITSH
jgi:uncharacterized protein